jgi:GNAT superfamily N-acetyltransferase
MRNVLVARGMVRHTRCRNVGMTLALSFRAATPSDADRLGHAVIEGFAGYRSFAPPDWSPPSVETEIELLQGLLGDADVWCLLAEADGRLVGQITFLPAARHARAADEPGLAHLRNLFIHQDFWGSGLAGKLHAAAVEEARARGFTQMRLFTPAGHGRARRFYEREGWVQVGEEFHEPGPDLVIVEYRLAIGLEPMAG